MFIGNCTYRNAWVRFFMCVMGVLRSGAGEEPGDSASDSATKTRANARSSSFISIDDLWTTKCTSKPNN